MKKIISIVLISAFILSFSVLFSSCTIEETDTLYVYNWGEYMADGFDDTEDVNALFEEWYVLYLRTTSGDRNGFENFFNDVILRNVFSFCLVRQANAVS